MLVPVDQGAYDTRLTDRSINCVQIGDPAVVVDARQVKRPRGVMEVDPNGAISVEAERSDRRHFGRVFVDREEPVTEDVDSEHPTQRIDSNAYNRHALWNAEQVADYRRRYFVTPVDASQEEVCVSHG